MNTINFNLLTPAIFAIGEKNNCDIGVASDMLPEVCFSDSLFGETDFAGYLPQPVPIHGVLGDSHGALFGQGCLEPGMMKATYGTGSSVMLNIGEAPVFSSKGVVTSLALSLIHI